MTMSFRKTRDLTRPISKKSLTVTVAICTYHRPHDLLQAMRSLIHQTRAPQEVIIVDNGCQASIKALVHCVLPRAKYVAEPSPGLDFARNRAICEAGSEILAFLDDDAVADKNWIDSIIEAFKHNDIAALTGLILPLELNTKAQQLFELNGGFGRGYNMRIVPDARPDHGPTILSILIDTLRIGSGCNMAFQTHVLKELKGFDNALDAGAPLPGGGDLDMFYRVMRNGRRMLYAPKAIVKHRHRRSLETLSRQLSGHQRSVIAFLIKTLIRESNANRIPVSVFLFWRLVKPMVRLFKGLIGRDVLPLALLIRMLRSTLIGIGSYHASKRRIHKVKNDFSAHPHVVKDKRALRHA